MTKLRINQDNSKSWKVTDSYIAGATIERGSNAGQPNPNAGQVVWNENNTKYPGNMEALAHWLLDYGVREFEATPDDIAGLKNSIEALKAAIEFQGELIIEQLRGINREIEIDL